MAATLLVPVTLVRIGGAILLMTFFPGAVLWSLADSKERNPLLFLLCGAAFLTVLVYYCAWVLWFPIPIAISFVCAVFVEKKKVSFTVNKKTMYLLGCMLFMVLYLYPWGEYTAFYPPGDEMKLHLLYTNTIVQEKMLPSDYAPLYPQITEISQPLGFHGVTAFTATASRASIITVSTFLGIFLACLSCISIYLLGKTLFSEEKGLAAAFSFAFLSFVSHQLGFSGSYTVLAGITFQIAAVALLLHAHEKKTTDSYIIAGLFCAACFSTDLNAFFPLISFFVLFLIIYRSVFPVIPAFFLLSLPQLSRFSLPSPTALEMHFIQEWSYQNAIGSPQLWITLFSVGPLLLLFALLQLFSIKKIERSWINPVNVITGLYSLSFFIPLVVSLKIMFYFVDPVLIFRMIAIPLSLLSALFLIRLHTLQYRWFLTGVILFSAVIHVTDPFVILPSSPPTVNADSLSAYEWISQNTAPGSSFCNFTSSKDSSTWIPVVCNRPVFLPFHLYYPKDNAMSKLKLPERFTDSRILMTKPDSEFARKVIEKYQFSYVYIDEKSPIAADMFLNSPLYTLEYQQKDVYIFSLTDADPVQCHPVRSQLGRDILYRYKSYFYFANLKGGALVGIYYQDRGFGNVDVEINGEYAGTIFRFDSGDHFLVLFLLPSSEEVSVSFLPYEDVFYIDYLIIYECGED